MNDWWINDRHAAWRDQPNILPHFKKKETKIWLVLNQLVFKFYTPFYNPYCGCLIKLSAYLEKM
jgi:hypothetical protein